ncbi:MAG: type I DNA topoisomerase, partial [Clostridia bacterium]|nr:type I DNA topoisomerase [Clostridia bacterium]
YWNIDAWFKNGNKKYAARLAADTNGKIAVTNKEQADKIRKDLEGAEYCVSNIKTQEKQKNPQPPFITSSLLQDASNRLNMSSRRTMTLAQHLYEGLEVKGHGLVGLITYMRTDSPRISDEARAAAKELIEAKYGAEYYPKTPRVFKTKKDAQDAHEAIRPTDVNLTPETVRESLTPEHYRLYKLIWDRFMASQMASAVYNTRSVEITANGYLFRASDSQLLFDGFTTLYHDAEEEQDKTEKLPAMEENTVLPFAELTADQKFTQPPARYNEASLIQAMKDYGIGRPSTYATIIGTILDRNYVEHESRSLKPTQLGYVTTDLMIDHFKNIVDTVFTADMETKLDIIEEGETTSLDVLQSFYTDFAQSLKIAEEKMDGVKIALPLEESDVVCELCGRKMVYKVSRFGRFLACPGYPECKNTKPIRTTAPGKCPKCGSGLLVKKTKTGKVYYGCEKNGECGFMTWDIPTTETCPKCGNTLFRHLSKLNCQKEGCDYSAAVEKKSKKDTSNGDEADES